MSQSIGAKYAMKRIVNMSYEEAVQRVKDTLKEQGFGILTEIDVKKTMKEKIDAEFEPYIILGACNPQLARIALAIEPSIGVLLPCNVVVYRQSGATIVEAMDPVPVMGMVANPNMEPVATEVKKRLNAALEAM